LNVWLFSNFTFKIAFFTRRRNTGLLFHKVTLEGSCICHCGLSVNLCFQHRILGTVNGTTVSCTSASFWNLWPPACIFQGLWRWKLLGAKSGLYSWCLRHCDPNCCNEAAICQAVWGLGTKWLSSLWPCEEASSWSQMPNWCRSARRCLTLVLLTKPRILCWRHAFTDNM
jgi:hypothetical protein